MSAVLKFGCLRGLSFPSDLDITLDVSGESREALVEFGSARRATVRGLGLGVVCDVAVEEVGVWVPLRPAAGSAMRRTALGVAVGVDGRLTVDFCARFFGVTGGAVSSGGDAFLLRAFAAGAGVGGTSLTGLASARALIRADLRLDIVKREVSSVDPTCTARRPLEMKTVAVSSSDGLQERYGDSGLEMRGEILAMNIGSAQHGSFIEYKCRRHWLPR